MWITYLLYSTCKQMTGLSHLNYIFYGPEQCDILVYKNKESSYKEAPIKGTRLLLRTKKTKDDAQKKL